MSIKIGDAIFAIVIGTGIFFLSKGCIEKEVVIDRNQINALNQCIQEVTKKCSASIAYAIALEDENARLNRKLSNCRRGSTY